MRVQVRRGSCLDFTGDAVLFFHHSDIRPLEGSLALLDWRCNGIVSRLWKKKRDLMDFGRMSIIAPQGKVPASKALITGLGPAGSLDSDLRKEALRIALSGALKVGVVKLALDAGVLEKGLPEGIGEDLNRVLGGLEIPESFAVALFHQGKQVAQKPEKGADRAAGVP